MSDAFFSKKVFIANKVYMPLKSFHSWLTIVLVITIIQLRGSFFTPLGDTGYKDYMRYHPYANIITKQIDKNRESLFFYYHAE
jgi:hypothetical protein